MSTTTGHHRLAWDLRYAPPPGANRQYSIAAVYQNTPSGPNGPFVHPGRYTVRLTVDGATFERPLDVRMDPRVTIAPADLQAQTDLSLACYRAYLKAQTLGTAIDAAVAGPGVDAARKTAWQALRGDGVPGDPDVIYEFIVAMPAAEESVDGAAGEVAAT